MKIRIYQIDHEKDQNHIRYEGVENTLKFSDNKIDPAIYRQIYGGTVECSTLDDVYSLCNSEQMPPGYYGESMSVSNVVEVCDGTQKGFYFVDSVGFKPIEFDRKQAIQDNIIKVLIFEPKKEPYTAEIQNRCDAMKSVIGGLVEAVYPFDDNALIYCNEEFRLIGLEGNRYVEGISFGGNFMILGDTGNGENCSLTDEQLQRYADLYRNPDLELTQEMLEDDIHFMVMPL